MSWVFLEDVRDRLHRKVNPVTYIDMETRVKGMDPANLETLCMAYKTDDGPVHILPWEAACARGDWRRADRLSAELFAEIRRKHRLHHDEDLARVDKSWLARKFLTFAAWARTFLER